VDEQLFVPDGTVAGGIAPGGGWFHRSSLFSQGVIVPCTPAWIRTG
jgi:hypothetical protein